MKIKWITVLSVLVLLCCQVPPKDMVPEKNQVSPQDVVSVKNEQKRPQYESPPKKINEKLETQKATHSFFTNKPLWVDNLEKWQKKYGNGHEYRKADINVYEHDKKPTFSQIEEPSVEQLRSLEANCLPDNFELIDYFWFGEKKVTKLYGLCIKKKKVKNQVQTIKWTK